MASPSKTAKSKSGVQKRGRKERSDSSASDGPSTPRPTSLKDDKEVKAKKQPEPKANVRDVIGGIEVQVANEWVPAVYLDDIRERVLRETEAQGSYDYPPARGKHELDVTAFHADHQTWGEPREQRPMILFEFKRNDREDPEYDVGTWVDNGRVVLGPDSLPIRDFHDIPKLCSSQMEGFRMEAISRIDSRICISDFRARMMANGLPGANSISMRKTRFRLRGRCSAWEKRAGSNFWEEKLKADMTEAMINSNSTEELVDLTPAQAEQLQLENSGKAPARAKGRALPNAVRALRFRSAKEKNEKKLEAEAKKLQQEGTEETDLSTTKPETDNVVVGAKKRKRTTNVGAGDLEDESSDESSEEGRGRKKRRSSEAPFSHNPVGANKRKRLPPLGAEESWEEHLDEFSKDERPQKKRCNQTSADESDGFIGTKRKRATEMLARDSVDEYVDQLIVEERSPKRSRTSNALDNHPRMFISHGFRRESPPLRMARRAANGPSAEGQMWSSRRERSSQPLTSEGNTNLARNRSTRSTAAMMNNADSAVDQMVVLPVSEGEQLLVQVALAPTRRHYETLTPGTAPVTNPRENYLSQYITLQLHLDDVWRTSGKGETAPTLPGLDAWERGHLRWNQNTYSVPEMQTINGHRLFKETESTLHEVLEELIWRREALSGNDGVAAAEPYIDLQTSAEVDAGLGFQESGGFQQFAGSQPPASSGGTSSADISANTTAPAAIEAGTSPVQGGDIDLGIVDHRGPGEEFQEFLDSMLGPQDPLNWDGPVYQGLGHHEQLDPVEHSFFTDAFDIHQRAAEDQLYTGPQEPQEVVSGTLDGNVHQAGNPNAEGETEDLDIFGRGWDFWLT